MIILEGPDNSGKSTLAKQLLLESVGSDDLQFFKAIATTSYQDYLNLLRGPKCDPRKLDTWKPGLAFQTRGAVLCDRIFFSEIPYAHVLRGQERIQWTLKQWHNMYFSLMTFNPLVILTCRQSDADRDDVPREMFQPILREYRQMFSGQKIDYMNYDFKDPIASVQELLEVAEWSRVRTSWLMVAPELYGVGNTVDANVFIMAQDLGPSNVHRIPFEMGPSGYYLSELLDGKDLSSIYLTNWLKTEDPGRNAELLRSELANTQAEHVILLGRKAEASSPILEEFLPRERIHTIVHPGWVVNHAGSIPEMNRRKEKLQEQWEGIWDQIELTSQQLTSVSI